MCMGMAGCGAGVAVAQESQNWAVTMRQGFLLELDLCRQNIYLEVHPVAGHAGLGLGGWGWHNPSGSEKQMF